MSLNQLTTNFLEAYKTNNIASTLFCLQPIHLTMTLDLKDNYQIPNYSTELHKRSFIPHSLFQYY